MTAGVNKVFTGHVRSRIAACEWSTHVMSAGTQRFEFPSAGRVRLVGLFKGIQSCNVRRIVLVKFLAFKVTRRGQKKQTPSSVASTCPCHRVFDGWHSRANGLVFC